jgi:hypothetical protein
MMKQEKLYNEERTQMHGSMRDDSTAYSESQVSFADTGHSPSRGSPSRG